MGQQLGFILKKKDNEDIQVDLVWFSTTPARRMSSEGVFSYTEKDVLLDNESLESYLYDLKEIVNDKERSYRSSDEEVKDLEDKLLRAKSKNVINALLERIDDEKRTLKYLKEDMEDWKYHYLKISIVRDVYNDNKENWNLYYYNC